MVGRRIIVHDLKHARAALAAAEELGVGLTLVSAPGAAAYLGAAVFRHMIAEAGSEHPEVPLRAVLDCGGDPGLVLNALRQGIEAVRVQAPPKVCKRLADIARRWGAVLDTDRGEALDLIDEKDPVAACRAWLVPEPP